ncbi:MAG TPA: polysaccharide biosynthesis tyrosine autokinase [Bryobacteraceae bacterium]|nr:polysaccharide biosynthesis tyrosine autokinase [Bryobacteraceae bacterium]
MPRKYLERPIEMERADQAVSVPAVMKTYPVTPPPSSGDPVGLNDLAAALWRGRWIILPAALAGILAGLLVTAVMSPVYRARTSVQIEGYNDQVMPDLGQMSGALPNATPDNYLQNEVKLLESDSLAKRVANVVKPTPPPPGIVDKIMSLVATGFGLFPQLPESPEEARIHAVQTAMNVRTSLQSQVIELFYDAGDPQTAALGANAAAQAFIAMNNDARTHNVEDTTQWLNKQAEDLRVKIDSSNQQLEGFARSSGLVFAENQNTLAEDQMKNVEDTLAKATADRVQKQAAYEAARDNPARLITDSSQNSPLHQYEINLETLKAQLAQLKTQFTGDYYKVKQIQSQIAATEAEMDRERTELLGRMKVDYIAAASQERMLQQQHAEQLRSAQQQMENQRRYETQKSQVDAMEKLYETLLAKAKEAGAESALRATNVRVIDPAVPPSSTYSPRPALNAAIGLALGLMFAVGFVLVRGESDRVKRPGESPLPDVPELGVIPAASSGWVPNGHRRLISFGKREEPGLVNWDEEASMLTESFRAALTSILFGPSAKRDGGGQVLVVTSAHMMEGKTTVLANLGIASAERRRRVLLVDADLRRPQLHAAFKLENDRGLATVLKECSRTGSAEDVVLENYIQRGSVPGLYVLTGGPPGSAHLLYSCDLTALLGRLRREFDLVFVDTPPMLLYSDSRVLGRVSDGVVMVVRADSTRGEELRSTYLRLMQDQIPVIGTILNKWKMDPGQHKAYGRYYANYGSSRGA